MMGHPIDHAILVWFVASVVLAVVFGAMGAPAVSLALVLSLFSAFLAILRTPELPDRPVNGALPGAWGAVAGLMLGGLIGFVIWPHPRIRSRRLLCWTAGAFVLAGAAAVLLGRVIEIHAARPVDFGPRKIGSSAYWHAVHRLIVANAMIGQVPVAALLLALLLVVIALRVPARAGAHGLDLRDR
jgi:hypothetical protein